MLGSRRGLHLAAYARSAGRAKRKKERLTPAQYVERRRAAGGVRVVVLLLGHKGVSRPDVWLELVSTCPAVALLVHSEVELPERLESWRFPRSQVTAWEDITLFVLICRMLEYALNAYQHATIVYTCSGDGITIVSGDILERPWAHVGMPEGSPILGINPTEKRITVPKWEPLRQLALSGHCLPPMPVKCYGSQWVGLTRSDAEAVVAANEKHGAALAGAYRTAYAYAAHGHGQGHARLHPEEEFLPYVLHVLSARPWPEVYGRVMAEATDASPSRCPLCHFRVGHSAVLTPAREESVRRLSPSCLFLRKVTPLQEAGRRQEEEQLQEARQGQEEERQEQHQHPEQQQQDPQQQGHEGSISEGGGSHTGPRAHLHLHTHVRTRPYVHPPMPPRTQTYPHAYMPPYISRRHPRRPPRRPRRARTHFPSPPGLGPGRDPESQRLRAGTWSGIRRVVQELAAGRGAHQLAGSGPTTSHTAAPARHLMALGLRARGGVSPAGAIRLLRYRDGHSPIWASTGFTGSQRTRTRDDTRAARAPESPCAQAIPLVY